MKDPTLYRGPDGTKYSSSLDGYWKDLAKLTLDLVRWKYGRTAKGLVVLHIGVAGGSVAAHLGSSHGFKHYGIDPLPLPNHVALWRESDGERVAPDIVIVDAFRGGQAVEVDWFKYGAGITIRHTSPSRKDKIGHLKVDIRPDKKNFSDVGGSVRACSERMATSRSGLIAVRASSIGHKIV